MRYHYEVMFETRTNRSVFVWYSTIVCSLREDIWDIIKEVAAGTQDVVAAAMHTITVVVVVVAAVTDIITSIATTMRAAAAVTDITMGIATTMNAPAVAGMITIRKSLTANSLIGTRSLPLSCFLARNGRNRCI